MFKQALIESFEEDPDANAKRRVVEEMMGYSLTASCEREKYIILLGSGANGKGVIMEAVQALVGIGNVSGVQPDQFDNKFQVAYLQDKLVNMVTEIEKDRRLPAAKLKAIVSGELTTAERKFQAPFDFRPFCKCWFGTNYFPTFNDNSHAIRRRTILIGFNRIFDDKEQDTKLKEKIKQELPGILNIALKGMARLYRRGKFMDPASSRKIRKAWATEVNSVKVFVKECCRHVPGEREESGKVYKTYSNWAKKKRAARILDRKAFTVALKDLGFKPVKGTAGTRFISGLVFK